MFKKKFSRKNWTYMGRKFEISEADEAKAVAATDKVIEISDSAGPDAFTDFFNKTMRGHGETQITHYTAAMLGDLFRYGLLRETNEIIVEGQAQTAIVGYYLDRYAREYAETMRPKSNA